MSSGASTSAAGDVRLKPDATSESRAQGLHPWQLFVLAALACATVGIFLTGAQGVSGVVLLTAMIGAAALVGLTTLLAVRPLVSDVDDRTRVIGHRTREALEREKSLALRALKELEFDRAMGKLSESDFQEMSSRLRARAARLIRQLDAGDGYRARIDRDVAERLTQSGGESDVRSPPSRDALRRSAEAGGEGGKPDATTPTDADRGLCATCATANDADAKFCKECGAKL